MYLCALCEISAFFAVKSYRRGRKEIRKGRKENNNIFPDYSILHIQIFHFERMFFNELPARLNFVPIKMRNKSSATVASSIVT